MRILLLGATGHTGSHVVDLALARGHELTAFVRSPQRLERKDPRLTAVQGDPLDVKALAQALTGHEAVISTLGPAVRETLGESTRMTDWGRSTVGAMKMADVHRIAILSAAVLFPLRGIGFAFFRWLLRHHARDLSGMEAFVRGAGPEWTIARPPRLVQTVEESYRSESGALPDGASTVSFRGVAKFLVDVVEQRSHLGEIVGLAAAR
jgi:putative NADH-flavin reductase